MAWSQGGVGGTSVGWNADSAQSDNVRTEKRRRYVADELVKCLTIDGIAQNIAIEDIERLCERKKTPRGRSPELMRKIIIEFLLVLREG